jgi:glucose/arabinose dehydrogenase
MMHKVSAFVVIILVIAMTTPIAGAQITAPKLSITTIATENLQVVGSNGVRGAAAAVLDDNQLLLGGGQKGSHLYLFDLSTKSDQLLGRVIPASERLNDARFAITDIAVLSKSSTSANLLISYPSYRKNGNCVVVKLDAYKLTLGSKPSITKGKNWFTSKPCVPISAVQHAAGRLAVIDEKTTYLTVGDLGFSKIGSKSARGDLGGVFKIGASKVEKISTGHRNQQGIELIGNDLYISEHGPRGGDELNLIKKGADYGWPTVTYGQAYSSGDYVRPTRSGTHDGFQLPLYNWVPSVAPTELVALPAAGKWGSWSSQLVMGTLKEQALIFIQLSSKDKVGQVASVDVSDRIRDLELLPDGRLVATTDSGNLLLISGGQ